MSMKIERLVDETSNTLSAAYQVYREEKASGSQMKMIDLCFMEIETFLATPFRDEQYIPGALQAHAFDAHKYLEAATFLSLSGLEKAAMSIIKNLVDIGNLLHYFTTDPDEIERWLSCSVQERSQQFKSDVILPKLIEAYRDGGSMVSIASTNNAIRLDYLQYFESQMRVSTTSTGIRKIRGGPRPKTELISALEIASTGFGLQQAAIHARYLAEAVLALQCMFGMTYKVRDEKIERIQKLAKDAWPGKVVI